MRWVRKGFIMEELRVLIHLITKHLADFIIIMFGILLALDKVWGISSKIQNKFGIRTKSSIEREHNRTKIIEHEQNIKRQRELIENLMVKIDEQNEKQTAILENQNEQIERILKHTASLSQSILEINKVDEALTKGMAALLRDKIKQAHKYYIEKQSISPTGLENITEIYKVYHDQLHENGVGEKMFKEIKNLPLKDDSEDGEAI